MDKGKTGTDDPAHSRAEIVMQHQRSLRAPCLAALPLLLVNGAAAQTTWTRARILQPTFAPAIAYDVARGRCVVFGGGTAETWEWDGSAWSLRSPPQSPTSRHSHAMCYDSSRGRVVLFGGYDSAECADTW